MDRWNMLWWPQEWQGWTVRTAEGAAIGTVVGRFERGPHASRLRVHRLGDGRTAVFAVPLSAIATAGNGTLRLVATATAEASEWLAYMVRPYRHSAGASVHDLRRYLATPPEEAPPG